MLLIVPLPTSQGNFDLRRATPEPNDLAEFAVLA
jgi:hypothetical protein